MKCGCKKTFCGSKVCKCKKNGTSCTADCACSEESCRNRQVVEVAEAAATAVPQLSWQNVLTSIDKERELLVNLSQHRRMPKRLEAIMKRRQGDFDEMKDLLQQMESLAVSKKNVDTLTAEQWLEFEANLVQCKNCERKFHPERIKKHEVICQRRTFVLQPK